MANKKTWRDISDSGWTEKPKERGKMGKRKRPKFRTKEDAEKDRKFRTGIRPSKKGGGWN